MDPLDSPSWYRVAGLRPRLAAEARFHRHVYRGTAWYVVRSPSTGQVHRLAPGAYALVNRLDGRSCVQQAWDAVQSGFGDAAPSQDETLRLLGVLHGAGLLRGDVPPDTAALFRRAREEEHRERRGRRNPIAFRVPLLDPDAFLTRWQGIARPLFTRAAGLVWCAVVAAAALTALKHAPELVAARGSLLDPTGVMALWFAYPVVKGLHELGHAFAVKRWGGEVHEIGILFLVFLPVPYVDASAASVFPDKRRRMIVSAAGIGVELFLAALCALVWVHVEPGVVRHTAYAVMLLGGASTLLFNGNPLLRFDGYYVLADAIEIPNLAARANQYVGVLARRFVLGLRDTPLPESTPGERAWLVGYAIASFGYRTAVMLGIALYLATHFLAVGVILAVATLVLRVGAPLLRQAGLLLTDPVVGERRGRALAGAAGLLAALAVLGFGLPIPLRTQTEGVTWLPERAHVRAGSEGFVVEMLAEPDAFVPAGTPLIRTRDPWLEARVRALEAEVHALELQWLALRSEPVQSEIARERLSVSQAALARTRERADAVLIRSPADGIFVPAEGQDLVGRYFRQGEVLAYVVDLSVATVRVVLTQQQAALVQQHTRAAWARLDHDRARVLPAEILRAVPAASDRLPTPALGSAGGGPFAVDPSDPEGRRTLEPVFQFDLRLPGDSLHAAGERVFVRFDHGLEPVGRRMVRGLRRLLLRELGV